MYDFAKNCAFLDTHTVTLSGISDDPVLTVLSKRRSFVIYSPYLTVESLDFARSVASHIREIIVVVRGRRLFLH